LSLICCKFSQIYVRQKLSKQNVIWQSYWEKKKGGFFASQYIYSTAKEQETQLMLTNQHDAFRGQSRSPNMVPFHMVGIVSSWAIVTLSLRHAVFTMFDFKNVMTLKSGSEVIQGHWTWHHSIHCVWFPIRVL